MTGGEAKTCLSCQETFLIDATDTAFYQKIEVPLPTWCPDCRMQRRMAWRNERALYQRACNRCQQPIVTVYRPDAQLVVYCNDCWQSDHWDGLDYGQEIDWERDFFSQFMDVFTRTPLVLSDRKKLNVNSDYGNFIGNCNNCYLVFSVANSENVYYSYSVEQCKDCVDAAFAHGDELCYGNVHTLNAYHSRWLVGSEHCRDSSFLFNSRNSSDCFLSANLNNRQYVFGGEQFSKEVYEAKMATVDLGSYQTMQATAQAFQRLQEGAISRYATIVRSSDATGDHIINSNTVRRSFWVSDSEDVHYSLRIMKGSKEIWDVYGLAQGELIYEGFGGGFQGYHNLFSFSVDTSKYLTYSALCQSSANLFGCVGLRSKQYCILNKQYTKEEYEALVPKLIQQMKDKPYVDRLGRQYRYGEFFAPELSPFAYNETIAQEYFPLTKETSTERGFTWKEPEQSERVVTVQWSELPDYIRDADESLLQEALGCAHRGECEHQCTVAYRLIPEELDFYRRLGVPLPRLCPNCRHYERLKHRTPLKLWKRQCQCAGKASASERYVNQNDSHSTHAGDQVCPVEFDTAYSPDRSEIVYCEQCYQAETI